MFFGLSFVDSNTIQEKGELESGILDTVVPASCPAFGTSL